MTIKVMDVKEFREQGYLQELNRQFLHPLGLALSVEVNPETKEESFDTIWDYRDDLEGIIFDPETIDEEFVRRAAAIEDLQGERILSRFATLGFMLQPVHKEPK